VTVVPQVRISYGAGLDIPAARESRISVVGDDLVVTTPHTGTQTFPLSEVEALWWLDPATTASIFSTRYERFLVRHNRAQSRLAPDGVPPPFWSGSCVVVGPRGPVAAWVVDETAPGRGDAETKRRTSGSEALAGACGSALTLGPPDVALAAADVRRVALRSALTTSLTPRLATAGVLAATLLLSWGGVALDGEVGWPYALAAVVLSLPLAALATSARHRALRLVTTSPTPHGREVFRPPSAQGTPRQMQLGRDDVVLVPGDGGETWLPGPAVAGGVASIVVDHDRMRFRDHHGDEIQSDSHAWWLDGPEDLDALRSAAANSGITVEESAPFARAAPRTSINSWAAPSLAAGDLSLLLPWLMWLVAPLAIVEGLASVPESAVAGWAIAAGGSVALTLKVWCWWAWRRWLRAARRRGDLR